MSVSTDAASRDGEDRPGHLAPLLVGHADDGDAGDPVDVVDEVLDFGRVDVLAARDDHVLEPVRDVEVAVGVEIAEVAGAEPAVRRERAGRRLGEVEVAREDVRAGDLDLADRAGGARTPCSPAMRTSVKKCGRPTLPCLLAVIDGERDVAPGEVSVIPYPCENDSPRSS